MWEFKERSHLELMYTHYTFPVIFTLTVSLSSKDVLGMLAEEAIPHQ